MRLELSGVYKEYGGRAVLENVEFGIGEGEIVSLLGPNGAGKSTLTRLISGLELPSRGEIRVLGQEPQSGESRRFVGSTPQEIEFPKYMTARELIQYVAACYGVEPRLDETAQNYGLTEFWNTKSYQLSGGQKRRIAFALAFVGQPRLILLDEPTTGMDLQSRERFWKRTRDFRDSGGSVLLTTHYLHEAEELSDRIVLMQKGRVKKHGTVAEIVQSSKIKLVSFRSKEAPDPSLLRGQNVELEGRDEYRVWTKRADEFVRQMVHADFEFSELRVRSATLEETFRQNFEEA